MKLNLIILAATVVAVAGLTALLDMQKPKHFELVKHEDGISDTLPEFSFKTMAGESFSSKDFSGRYMLVNFWATWCAPCVAEFPRLLEIAQMFPDDVVLLAISSDSQDEAVQRFIDIRLNEQNRAILKQENVKIVRDSDSKITFDLFRTAMLPETIIVDPGQKMVQKLIGADWTVQEIKNIIEQP